MRLPQYNEIEILKPILPEKGYFVDIGAAGGWSNTDWLKDIGWKGIQLDAAWGHWITIHNVNKILEAFDVPDLFDFLSIDIDGNDYWIWKAIKKKTKVVCIEYNKHYKGDKVQKYDINYLWDQKSLEFGASKDALVKLAKSMGYSLVGENQANLIFKINENRTDRER